MKLLLKNNQCPGDILMLTAAVRDLKHAHPDIHINVKTSAMPLWDNNPHIDKSITEDNADKVIYAEYPLIHSSHKPFHFIHGFRMFLEDQLNLCIPQGAYCPDIHLAAKEHQRHEYVKDIKKPYWILNAGYKTDFTCKGWGVQYFQDVVNTLKDKITFVQVGERNKNHIHPKLDNVVDLIGKTSLRDMIQLMYHSKGVLSGVSFPMHLAAMQTPYNHLRHGVILIGGREPINWEYYPGMTFLGGVGMYDCCKNGACWKSRVVKLNDGDDKDNSLCLHPYTMPDKQVIPFCLADISVKDVVYAIERYRI